MTGHDWVPRWDLNDATLFDPMPTWMYRASASEKCVVPDMSGRLDLQGLILGTVSQTGYLLTVNNFVHDEHQIPVHWPTIHVESTEQLVRLATHDRCTDSRHRTTTPSHPESSHQEMIQMADFAAWLCHFVERPSVDPPDDFYVTGCGNFCNSCKRDNFDGHVALPNPPELYGCDECNMGDFDLCPSCFLIEHEHCYSPAHTLRLRPRTGLWIQWETFIDMTVLNAQMEAHTPAVGSEHRFARSFGRNTALNKWLCTSTDLVGSAGFLTRPGDLVVVLFGANVPFILRRRPDTGRYRIISDCYIDQMMDGQAVEMWKRGELELMDFPMS